MPRGVLIGLLAGVGGLILLASLPVMVMAFMMGNGHSAMMGGQGSDPGRETPVTGVSQVRAQDFAFAPANIVVDVGTTVTWTNYDPLAHTVTSDDGDELDSPLFGENQTFSYTFDTPGEYAYHCTPHPNMQGLVTVRPRVSS